VKAGTSAGCTLLTARLNISGGGSTVPGVTPDRHLAVQLNHVIPAFRSYPVAASLKWHSDVSRTVPSGFQRSRESA
jgi:hypothetical protein